MFYFEAQLFPDLGDKKKKKKGVHCFIALGEMMDPALFLRAFSPEVCCIPALVHARMRETPVRTDRECWESWDWHGNKDC